MNPLTSVHQCAFPLDAALGAYASQGAYADCYAVVLPRVVTQAEYVEAFYTTAVFKVERWLIATFLSRPSTDSQARQLAQGGLSTFAAWSVEQQQPDQLVLAARQLELGEDEVVEALRNAWEAKDERPVHCLLYTSPSPRD